MPCLRFLLPCRLGRLLAASCLLAGVASCGSAASGPGKPVFPVRGQVFVNDQPAAGAFVLFIPVNEPAEPADPRPRATVEADGSYSLSTYGENDGAPAGEYFVTVTWPVDGRDDEDRLRGRYREPRRSRLTATVKDGPTEVPAFRLK
jgi:hypothetical protein